MQRARKRQADQANVVEEAPFAVYPSCLKLRRRRRGERRCGSRSRGQGRCDHHRAVVSAIVDDGGPRHGSRRLAAMIAEIFLAFRGTL